MPSTQDIINAALNKLQDVADDGEAMIVEQLAVKAGFWWKCGRGVEEGCGVVNNADDKTCNGCGRAP